MIEEFKPPIQEEKELDLSKAFKNSIVDIKKQASRPPLAISIGLDDRSYNETHYPLRFGTFGNISMIKGEEKARKSFLKSLLLACSIGGKSNNYTNTLEIQGHDLQDKYIIDLDTEQDEYDVWLNAIRIPKMVGAIPDNYISLQWRKHTPKERMQLLEWLFMESEYRTKLGVVSIDGYVDCLKNFNDQEESSIFTQNLMKFSSVAKCHITGVLHLNPGSTKARGHLGTILQQKCETVVIIKDCGDFSHVTCQRGRGKKFKDFTIRIDDDWLPYVSDDEIENNINLT